MPISKLPFKPKCSFINLQTSYIQVDIYVIVRWFYSLIIEGLQKLISEVYLRLYFISIHVLFYFKLFPFIFYFNCILFHLYLTLFMFIAIFILFLYIFYFHLYFIPFYFFNLFALLILYFLSINFSNLNLSFNQVLFITIQLGIQYKWKWNK